MTDERVIQNLAADLRWVEEHWGTYNQRRLDYRDGYAADSLPEHVAGSSDPGLPGGLRFDAQGNVARDQTAQRVDDEWREIRAGAQRAQVEVAGLKRRMSFLVNATKRLEDPPTQACGNVNCPDAKIFDMIGNDRPHDSEGRCAACHMAWKRSGYTRERSIKWQSTEDVEVA